MKQNYVTRDELREEFDSFEEKMDSKLTNLKDDIESKLTDFKSQTFDKLDYIVAELEAMREDRELGAYQTRNHEETLENHEKRINHLEKHSSRQ